MGTTERWMLPAIVVGWFALLAVSAAPVGTTLRSASFRFDDQDASTQRLVVSFVIFALCVVPALLAGRCDESFGVAAARMMLAVPCLVLGLAVATLDPVGMGYDGAVRRIPAVGLMVMTFVLPASLVLGLPVALTSTWLMRWAKRRDDAGRTHA